MAEETPFSNRELTAMFEEIKRQLDQHDDTHKQILSEVRQTNGKVAEIQRWRERVMGAMAVVMVIVLPLAGYVLYKTANISSEIEETLANYSFEVYEESPSN